MDGATGYSDDVCNPTRRIPRRWRFRPFDRARITELERAAGIPFVVAQLLLGRGITDPVAARRFIEPKVAHLHDPAELPDAERAAERILRAVRAGERITVYADYDADGITAAAIVLCCLRLLGARPGLYVPHRFDEGYGLNQNAIRTLASAGTQLLITVDCGIGSVPEAELAAQLGMNLIVTDHHEPGPMLPQAEALVHPRLPGGNYAFGHLSGSGLAFKLAWAVCRAHTGGGRVPEREKNFLLRAMGLAAIGTVADVVPLVGENRILVRHGLESLTRFPVTGVSRLMELAGLDKKSSLECEDVGYTLAPRLNAAGRLGQATLAVELLTTDDPDRAAQLAEYLQQLNGQREHLERSIYLAALKQATEEFDPQTDAALVLAERGWHPGVIGIVAGRLAERFHRPVVMIAKDNLGVRPAVGSARSRPGLNLHAVLAACSHRLMGHGGHAAAAGLKIRDDQIAAFRAEFLELVERSWDARQRHAELWIDAETPLAALNPQTVRQIEQLAPFGHGNPRPVLCTDNVRLSEPPRSIGAGGRHLSFRLQQHQVRMRAVGFGWGDQRESFARLDESIAVAFRPVINTFGGRCVVELQLADWSPASAPPWNPVDGGRDPVASTDTPCA